MKKHRRPIRHIRTLGYGPGKKIKRQKIINNEITYYPSMKKVKIKKLYKVMRPSDMEKLPKNGWIYEPKYDGSRGILMIDKRYGATFLNRRQIDATPSYPEFFGSTKNLRADQAVLDGEVVAVTDAKPLGDFKSLAQREHVEDGGEIISRSKKHPLKYFAFDILEKDGQNLTNLPLSMRRKILDKVVPDDHEDIKEIPYFKTLGELQEFMKGKDPEGYVVKNIDSTYQEDKKSNDWIKKKYLHENDVSILGYLPGKGKREGKIGALLVGVYNKKTGKYKVKSKVGTGFSDKELDSLTSKLNKDLIKDSSHISGKIASADKFVFVKPNYVARIQFLRETDKGGYREPRYIGLRNDISPTSTHQAIKPLKNFGAGIVSMPGEPGIKPLRRKFSGIRHVRYKKYDDDPLGLFKTDDKKDYSSFVNKGVKSPREIKDVARKIKKNLRPMSKRIEIAGSIRRGIPPKDVDIVLIPKRDRKDKIKEVLMKKGTIKSAGDQQIFANIDNVDVDVFFSDKDEFGAQLMTRTGPAGSNMSNRKIAKNQGLLLNQHGLFKGNKRIAGKTERSIYKKLGKQYRKPELRGEPR